MRLSPEPKVDALVDDPLALEASAQSAVGQKVDSRLLQNAGTHRRFDVFACACLEHHGLHAAQVEHMRQQQTRRPGAHDPDLDPTGRRHACSSPCGASSSAAIRKAAFAAGSPQ